MISIIFEGVDKTWTPPPPILLDPSQVTSSHHINSTQSLADTGDIEVCQPSTSTRHRKLIINVFLGHPLSFIVKSARPL